MPDLVTAGLNFLEQLTRTITSGSNASGAASPLSSPLASMVEKDKQTGKSTLKIPLPDAATLAKAAGIFDVLARALRGEK